MRRGRSRGFTIAELAIVLAIAAASVAAAVSVGLSLIEQRSRANAVDALRSVVTAARLYGRRAGGLDALGVASEAALRLREAGLVPEALAGVDDAIWLPTGQRVALRAGLDPSDVAAGAVFDDVVGVHSARAFLVRVGDVFTPVRDRALCAAFGVLDVPGLLGVQVRAAGDLTAPFLLMPGAPSVPVSASVARSWTEVFTRSPVAETPALATLVLPLGDRFGASMITVCSEAVVLDAGASLVFAFGPAL